MRDISASSGSGPLSQGSDYQCDEADSWGKLNERFEARRINQEEAYSDDGVGTNRAEEFFSRMRRTEIGHRHRSASAYLLRYAQEASWREDNRRCSNRDQTYRMAGLAMRRK